MSDRNPYYTLESFTLTDILEDEEYDLRKWENVSKFVDRLNHVTGNAIRLQNENNKLNIQLKTRVIVNKQYEKIKKLEKENEELRKQQQRLYNYFEDYLEDEMSAENFGEMWDTVKVDERWNDE